jgi:cytochrome c biogenesis protein CcdA
MIPLVVGFVGGSHDPSSGSERGLGRSRSFTLSLASAVGLAVTIMLLGVVASLVGGLQRVTSRVWYYLVAAVCILIGEADSRQRAAPG